MSLVYFLVGAGVLGLLTAYSQMDTGSKTSVKAPRMAQHSELCLSLLQEGGKLNIPPELANHPQLLACEKIKRMDQQQLVNIFNQFANNQTTKLKLEEVLRKLRAEAASTSDSSTSEESANEKSSASEQSSSAPPSAPPSDASSAPPSDASSEAPPMQAKENEDTNVGDEAALAAREKLRKKAEDLQEKANEAEQAAAEAKKVAQEAQNTVQSFTSEEEWLSVAHSWASDSDVDSSMTGYSDMSL